jgi:hypothetical protein
MNETKYTLLCNTGHTLTGLTSEQLVTMYREGRLPCGGICDEQSPNDVYAVENVVEVFCKDTGTYKNIATISKEREFVDQLKFSGQLAVVMIGTCLVLAAIGFPLIEFIERHF